MNSFAADDFKEQVRQRTDIVRLIEDYGFAVHAQRGGRIFKSLCPFHDDHDPSLSINPERQSYYCFVCSEGGDCFKFVMKRENVGFREALENLARRAGLELPTALAPAAGESTGRAELYDALAWAEQQFHQSLLQSASAEPARRYLRDRRLSDDTVRSFRLGFHPEEWQWLIDRARDRFSLETLQNAGLVRERDGGAGHYDCFVGRVMFPIRDERGRVVAFGGRVLPGKDRPGVGKYLNSDASPVFAKSKLVFGLDSAADAIRKTGRAIVMEGYVDCIKARQAGVGNAVCTLGTALTEGHVTMLKRLARKVVLVYDGDAAGVRASERALGEFAAQDVDLRILTLPDDLDPDEFIDQRGVEAFWQQVDEAPEAWDYKLRALIARHGVQSLDGRLRIVGDFLDVLAPLGQITNSLKEQALLSAVAQRLGMPEAGVHRQLADRRQALRRGAAARTQYNSPQAGRTEADPTDGPSPVQRAMAQLRKSPRKEDQLELEFLQILFTWPHMIETARQLVGLDDLQLAPLRTIYGAWIDQWENRGEATFANVLSALDDVDLKSLAVWIDGEATVRFGEVHGSAGGSARTMDAYEALKRIAAGLQWRRECECHEAAKGRAAQEGRMEAGWDGEARDLLQRAVQFHQKRAV